MYLSRLVVKNFRSIKEADIEFKKGKNVIIGKNNAGKSNIIKAIDIVLGESVPTYAKSEKVSLNDFYCKKEFIGKDEVKNQEKEIVIYIELTRESDESLSFLDEMLAGKAIKVDEEQSIRIDSYIDDDYFDVLALSDACSDEITSGKWYGDKHYCNGRSIGELFENKKFFAFLFKATLSEDTGLINKDMSFLFSDNKGAGCSYVKYQVVRNELLQSAIIPSFRDPMNQLRLSSWSWYGKLMRHLTSKYEDDVELNDALATVKSVSEKIFTEIESQILSNSLDVAFPETEISFQFTPDDKMNLYKNCNIYVDDGFKSELSEKGSGIQSATIIGLFKYYTEHVNTVSSALLCLEEPEIYLHPHARRVVSDRLDDFIGSDKNQVILTTHSSEFVKSIKPDLNVIHVTKNNNETKTKTINIRDYKKFLIDNNVNEMFFADKVILCEGYDEFIIKEVAKEFYDGKLDEKNISIINVGGKTNFKNFINLVLALDKKCFVVADFDILLRDNEPERNTYLEDGKTISTFNILNLQNEFFEQEHAFGDDWSNKKQELVDLRKLIKEQDEESFYKAKRLKDFAAYDVLTGLIKDKRKELYKSGVLILRGEIEDYFKKNDEFTVGKKLNLNKIYEFYGKLSDDMKVNELVHCKRIKKFLEVIFDA